MTHSLKKGNRGSLLQRTSPDNHYPPRVGQKLLDYFRIPLLVPVNLSCPKLGVLLGNRRFFATFVTVPEAPVYENDHFVLRQHNIGFPGKVFSIESISESIPKQQPSDENFRRRSGGLYPGHDITAFVLRKDIHRFTSLSSLSRGSVRFRRCGEILAPHGISNTRSAACSANEASAPVQSPEQPEFSGSRRYECDRFLAQTL